MAYVRAIYLAAEDFPKREVYGLASQLRRAAVSVPSNIAEGQGRSFDKKFAHFLSHALGSLMETETQVMIGRDLGYISTSAAEKLLNDSAEIGRLLNGLLTSVNKKEKRA